MSHSVEIERVRDIVDETMRQLELILGIDASRPGVRMAVETGHVKAFKIGAANMPPPMLPDEPFPPGDVERTPVYSPRPAVEVQATHPVSHSEPPQRGKPVRHPWKGRK